MNKVNDLVTLIVVSYHSDNILKKFLNQISDKYKIIFIRIPIEINYKIQEMYDMENFK